MSDLKSVKEIGAALNRSRAYVHALKAAMHAEGYPWPGNRITVREVLAWLSDHPEWRCTAYFRASVKQN